jgi:hypothetical protein
MELSALSLNIKRGFILNICGHSKPKDNAGN